jgi:hypothetical protein
MIMLKEKKYYVIYSSLRSLCNHHSWRLHCVICGSWQAWLSNLVPEVKHQFFGLGGQVLKKLAFVIVVVIK